MPKSNTSPNGLSWIKFGSLLLDTYDLDPLYPILVQANWPEVLLLRFLIGYWIFYSAGCACKLAESKDFYSMAIYGNENHWPRGHERRHMRGDNFIQTIFELKRFGSSEDVVAFMVEGKDFQTIGKAVRSFHGFGPWISWKVADMAERVLQQSVDFSNAEIAVYQDPVKGAALIGFGDQEHDISKDDIDFVFGYMEKTINALGYKAPPYQDRPVNIQEMETVACKYKSHCNGHYPVGLDTFEIHHGLQGWGDLAQDLDKHLIWYVNNLEAYGIRL